MPARVQKWGNSLAVRIPKAFAEEAGLSAESLVDIRLVDGSVVLTPVSRQRHNLDDLLAEVTDDNLHGEADFGAPEGREVW